MGKNGCYVAAAGLSALIGTGAANAATCSLDFGGGSAGSVDLTAPLSCTFSVTLGVLGSGGDAFFEVTDPLQLAVSGLTFSGTTDAVGVYTPNLLAVNEVAGTTEPGISFSTPTLTSGTQYQFDVSGKNKDVISGTLTLTPVPMPATAWLLFVGLLGIGGFAKSLRTYVYSRGPLHADVAQK